VIEMMATLRFGKLPSNVPNYGSMSMCSFVVAERGFAHEIAVQLATSSGAVSPTIRELLKMRLGRRRPTALHIRRALEAAGVEFIDENGGGPSVRLRTRPGKRPSRVPRGGAQ